MRLADHQVAMLGEAAVLIGGYGSLLSEFELETLAEVASRFCRCRRDADVTPAEWDAIAPAIEGMRAAHGNACDAAARALRHARDVR